jgi:tetratricopeptide (TPR) repeat protein
LLPFVPRAAEVDQTRDRRLMQLAQTLAECVSVQAAATWALENQPWDFAAVYFHAIDQFCHRFMYYHPPRMSHIPEEDFALYNNVIWSAYCFHDLLLGRLLQLTDDETAVLLVSDHGYHSDHLRPAATPATFAGPAQWHRGIGVCVMKGPHVRRDELLFGATVLDVTPTVLTLFGLPLGADMDGKPWLHAFESPVAVEKVPSWESVPGRCGMHPPDRRGDPFQDQQALAQLADLGYILPPSADAREAVRRAEQERDLNLAQSLLHAGRAAEALPALERLHAERPDDLFPALHLTSAYFALGRWADCRRVVEHVAAVNGSARSIEDPDVKIVAQVDYLFGMLELAEGRSEQALEYFLRAERQATRLSGYHAQLGQAYGRLGRWADARRAYETALETDPDDAAAHHGMAAVLLALGQDDAALEHGLRSVGLLYRQPRAHYYLGIAFRRLGMAGRAAEAFKVSLAMDPDQPDARRELAALLRAAPLPV